MYIYYDHLPSVHCACLTLKLHHTLTLLQADLLGLMAHMSSMWLRCSFTSSGRPEGMLLSLFEGSGVNHFDFMLCCFGTPLCSPFVFHNHYTMCLACMFIRISPPCAHHVYNNHLTISLPCMFTIINSPYVHHVCLS